MSEQPKCELCGEPMPAGEEMFKFHGYSGPCPGPPLPRTDPRDAEIERLRAEVARLGGVVAAAVQAEQVARDDSKSLSPLNAFLDKHYPKWTEDGTDDVYINALMAVSEKLDASRAKLSTLEAAANDLCRSTLIDELEARGMPYTAERVRRLCAALNPTPPASNKEPT